MSVAACCAAERLLSAPRLCELRTCVAMAQACATMRRTCLPRRAPCASPVACSNTCVRLACAQRLVADVLAVAAALLQRLTSDVAAPPPLLLVGHSLGGCIAARAAATGRLPTLRGVAVLDIVEGTALAAIPSMRAALATRPLRFKDASAARAWARAPAGPAFLSQLVPAPDGGAGVVWRTPLQATEPFWEGWFRCATH